MKNSFFKNSCTLVLFCLVAFPVLAENTKQAWRAPEAAVLKQNPVPYTVESVTQGKDLFEQHCQKCHGYWGEGNGVVGLSLNKKPANLLRIAGKKAEGEFAWKIAEGRGEMPAFKKTLSEDEIWHIVNFVESLENEQGSGDPVAIK